MRLDTTRNAHKQTYLHYGNNSYAKAAEEQYYDTLERERVSFDLGRAPRIAFYNRYRPAVDPLCTDKMTEIAKIWLPRIGSLERVIIEKEGSWEEYEKLDDGDYDLIVTPDIHQFGDTIQEAIERIQRLQSFLYFELENMLSDGDYLFFSLQLAMSEETKEKELPHDSRHYFLGREKKQDEPNMERLYCPYLYYLAR
ncbi:MAG: hypothetical protein IJK38_05445 [Oscillospiraceae bacterium]|nr:hypothetical protein [Oscillospiraceae bacterium]